MDIRQNNNDFTVHPASRMMSSNAMFAKIFSDLADHNYQICSLILLSHQEILQSQEELDKRVSDLEMLAFDPCIPMEYKDEDLWGEDE